jgi:hypothetical protein
MNLFNIYFTGTAGDSFISYHNGIKFSTQDVDNDIWSNNCAQNWHGAWCMFHSCFRAHLNGKYIGGLHIQRWHGVIWNDFKGAYYSLKGSEMKVGPDKV